MGRADSRVQKYMQEMINERRAAEVKAERHDLFSSLLDANMDEELAKTGGTLVDSELLGNIFIFLLAGHEVCLAFFNFVTCTHN